MNILRHPFFLSLASVALVVYLARILNAQLPHFVRCYLNDLLCMPIVFCLCLALMRTLKRNRQLYVPLSIIVVITAYYAFHFEWLLPQFHQRYTSDIIDVFLYAIGTGLLFKFQKQLF